MFPSLNIVNDIPLETSDNTLKLKISENEQQPPDSFEFITPNWSKTNNTPQQPISEFISPEGPTDLVNTKFNHTAFSIFQLIFSNEIFEMIVYQTNLYAHQIKMETGKNYVPTNKQEIMTFLGMNILMGGYKTITEI